MIIFYRQNNEKIIFKLKIMKKSYIKIIYVILSINILLYLPSFAQDTRIVVVKDSNGDPIVGASIILGEGTRPVLTNENGEFSIPEDANLPVLIEAEGFESMIVNSLGLNSVELQQMPYEMGQKDKVYVPFGTFSKRQITGAVTVLNPQELLMYDQQKSVRGALNGRIPGLFGSSDIRGYGSPLYVINGVPRQGIDITLQEIEQITVMKDLFNIMLYGPQANNGVVYITTRRGEPLKRNINVKAESGLNIPISYPNYLSASDYMELYNEALANDGKDPKYTASHIESTRSGIDPVRYPDEDYYNSTYLKDYSTYYNIISEITEGNEIGQFYLNVGWNRNTGLLAIVEGANERSDRLSLRSNIDYKLTKDIDMVFGGSVVFNFREGPRYSNNDDFWGLSSKLKPDIFPVLIPSKFIKDQDMLESAKLIENAYVLGGTSEYQTNIYGELMRNGTMKNNDRLIEMDLGLNFSLSSLTEGLSAKAYSSFDMFSIFEDRSDNSYAVYRPNYEGDTISSFTRYGRDIKVPERTVSDVTFYRRLGISGNLDYRRAFNNHSVTATGLVFLYHYNQETVRQPTKSLHYGVRVNYIYLNKYIAELAGVYAGSGKLYESDNKFAFSPGIGLGWIASEESLLQDNSLIDYLKLRANWAISNTDDNIDNFQLTKNYYQASGNFYYNHGGRNNRGMIFNIGNTALGWEKVMNTNLGFEAMLLDYRIGIEGSYFYNKNYDLILMRENTLPVFLGALSHENYGSYQHQGIETGLKYNARVGDIKLQIGTNLTYSFSELLQGDELAYEDDYRRLVGNSTNAMVGYVAMGLFNSQTDIDNHHKQTFGDVQPGDVKYKDLNNDGVIDERDQTIIGNSKPTLQYGLHLKISYKTLELFALGTGQKGEDKYFNNNYYWVYGDNKYSEVVLNRWTPSTSSTADYPRLSSTANANNFRNSTFWLYESNWFGLHTLQLTYNTSVWDIIGLDKMNFFIRGNNLFIFSPIREKLELNVGSEPQMRQFSLGLNLMF